MCTAPNYCAYCLKRKHRSAVARGDEAGAMQIQSILHERARNKNAPKVPAQRIDLSSIRGKIAIDLDDTVGAWEDDFRNALARADGLTNEQALERYPPNLPGGLSDWFGGDREVEFSEYKRVEALGHLYHAQPVREGAGSVVNWLHKETDGRVVFLTARPEFTNDVSRAWLKDRVGVTFEPDIQNSRAKHEVEDFDVMIDDSASHVNQISAPDAPHGPRKVIFMTQPPRDGQVAANNGHVHRAWSWSDVREILSADT